MYAIATEGDGRAGRRSIRAEGALVCGRATTRCHEIAQVGVPPRSRHRGAAMTVFPNRAMRTTALVLFGFLFGCPKSSDPCGDLEYEPETESCVCPAGFVPRPELGVCEGPDGSVVRFDGGPPMLDAGTDVGEEPDSGFDAGRDTGVHDTGVDSGFSCGAVGEPCCAAPSSACLDGANCTPEGCESCGNPGEPCCDDGPACRTLTCITATDRCPRIGPLVEIPRPGGGTHRIDAYEVTRDEYEDWLATSPTNTGGAVGFGCGGNASFAPSATCLASGAACSGAACGPFPQPCVDWCDAFAYCASIGKQLCGGIGGGAVARPLFDDPSTSAWYNACSSGGVNTWGTGNDPTFAEDECLFTDVSIGSVYGLTTCQSDQPAYRGVFAMTGNVREWIDSCERNSGSGATPVCLALGGSFGDNDSFEGRCDFPVTYTIDRAFPDVGLRCCGLDE